MSKSRFDNSQVKQVSDFLQGYMRKKRINNLSADECALLLNENNILSNRIGPKPGFNFRQMLRDGRDGRDGLIDMVEGATQERPNTKWIIELLEN